MEIPHEGISSKQFGTQKQSNRDNRGIDSYHGLPHNFSCPTHSNELSEYGERIRPCKWRAVSEWEFHIDRFIHEKECSDNVVDTAHTQSDGVFRLYIVAAYCKQTPTKAHIFLDYPKTQIKLYCIRHITTSQRRRVFVQYIATNTRGMNPSVQDCSIW